MNSVRSELCYDRHMMFVRLAQGSFAAGALVGVPLLFALPTSACLDSALCGTTCAGSPDCSSYTAATCPTAACALGDQCRCSDPGCAPRDGASCNAAKTQAACGALTQCAWGGPCVSAGRCFDLPDDQCASVKGCKLERNCN